MFIPNHISESTTQCSFLPWTSQENATFNLHNSHLNESPGGDTQLSPGSRAAAPEARVHPGSLRERLRGSRALKGVVPEAPQLLCSGPSPQHLVSHGTV